MHESECVVLEQSRRLEEVQREEQELLETQSVPLRNYLMKHVMPTLTSALRDCVSIRPDDPIDFLVRKSLKYLTRTKYDMHLMTDITM